MLFELICSICSSSRLHAGEYFEEISLNGVLLIPNEDQSRTIDNDSEFDVWSEMVMWKLNFGVCRQLDLNCQIRKVKIENYGD